MDRGYEILEHPADIGFRAFGRALEELFENAAQALISIAGDADAVEEREQRSLELTGDDTESLLFAWLAEIVAIADADRLALRRAKVTHLREGHVQGVVYGERFDRNRHRAGTAIKAVTFHRFLVQRSTDGWIAEVFLDL